MYLTMQFSMNYCTNDSVSYAQRFVCFCNILFLAQQRMAKAIGAMFLTTLCNLEVGESFEPTYLGEAAEVCQECVRNKELILIKEWIQNLLIGIYVILNIVQIYSRACDYLDFRFHRLGSVLTINTASIQYFPSFLWMPLGETQIIIINIITKVGLVLYLVLSEWMSVVLTLTQQS